MLERLKSWTLLFACNLMWALQFTCIKLVESQVGPLFTVWGPMTLATVMLCPVVYLESTKGRVSGLTKRDAFVYLLLAAFGVFPAQVFMTWGTRMSLASNAALISLTVPVSTAVFAWLCLGERMTRVRWVSFAAAIVGVLLCSGRDVKGARLGGDYFAGNILIFGSTLGSAFYNSYGKKMLERHAPIQMLFYTYLAMALLMMPVVLLTEGAVFRRITEFSPMTWTGLVLLTLFHNYLSMVLFLKALKRLDATQAALSNYLVSVFGLVIAALWLGERPMPWALIGGALVLISTLLITLYEAPRSI